MFPGYTSSVWDGVVGQERAVDILRHAVDRPVHAYLLVGPPGCTKAVAARAFAAMLLAGIDDAEHRDARLALSRQHPDVTETERVGASIDKAQVSEVIRVAALAPVEGRRKVMILHDFHLLEAEGAARLLKTLEEPINDTVFLVLADQIPPELVTIASRCVRVDFSPIPDDVLRDTLLAEGHDPDMAQLAARAAAGDLDRARLLATDDGLMGRRAAFASVPARLDGSGAMVVRLATELATLIEEAAAPLLARQAREVAELEEIIAAAGERGSGRKALEDRHKRELRRHRTDEWRAGLAVMASEYRDALVAGRLSRPDAASHAIERIHRSLEALDRNPVESLLVQALLLELPALPDAGR